MRAISDRPKLPLIVVGSSHKQHTKIYLEASIMDAFAQSWLDWSRRSREDIIRSTTRENY